MTTGLMEHNSFFEPTTAEPCIEPTEARTGVLTTHHCRNLLEEIAYHSVNVSQAGREKEFYNNLRAEHDLPDSYDFDKDPLEVVDRDELEGMCMDDYEDTLVIGFKFNDETGLYEEDPAAEYSAIVNEYTTQVTQSKYITYCNKCSPCFPYQGDLNNPGDIPTFTLPPELWGEDLPAWQVITELKNPALNETGFLVEHGTRLGISMF